MDEKQEIKSLLRRNIALAEENNRLLKGLRRSQWINNLLRLVYMIVIIVVPLYFYFNYVLPYYESFRQTFGGGQVQGLPDLDSIPQVKEILDRFATTTKSR